MNESVRKTAEAMAEVPHGAYVLIPLSPMHQWKDGEIAVDGKSIADLARAYLERVDLEARRPMAPITDDQLETCANLLDRAAGKSDHE